MTAMTTRQSGSEGAALPAALRASGSALALVCAAQFVLQLDFSIVNVALPTIQRQLHFTAAHLQWIVTGYALTFGSLLLLGGRAGDLIGHRRLLLVGLSLFGVSSLSAGFSLSPGLLIGSRFIQGASAALVAPSALALLTFLFNEGPPRTRALGMFQGATAAGATAGIVLGGLLTQYVGWRAIFLVNPPIVVVLSVLALRLLPNNTRGERSRLDVAGAVLVTASVAALIYGLSEGQQQGFGAPAAVAALLLAVLAATAFVLVERRVAVPMLPLGLFADRPRRAALAAVLAMGGVLAGYVYFITLYLQTVLHYSALRTGLALVPATVTVMAVSMFGTRRLLARLGTKRMLLLGLVGGDGLAERRGPEAGGPGPDHDGPTLTLTGLVADPADVRAPRSHTRRRLAAVAAMLIGAAGGALLVLQASTTWALGMAGALLVVAAVAAGSSQGELHPPAE